ncbi:beta-ketoacyl synthase N-terminal-like domain-containing protein [Flavitalea sp. BT771]|uniref:beta-ketoacyl-[acyl-carrier-protein] synthase family protein n=1 Tax=Flavitalea sp. BT771 TaxID=3063329 RepID=UPI0026E18637|nr:beta-ketoacyl synthase N-terminal-like domain-containing protein [Flavitalea sp. BT771]MDO6429976.1 beta-ketoacyl synthase N-terminal-like domain-containing protein [Flavitalea sp. BT771]MDV6217896.1 beta-ketoacyl synthase N-terminal-like domain-containing protein [Flavitalea sp. BT771]
MTDVFVVSDNILSPLGWTTAENFTRLKEAVPGIRLHGEATFSTGPFYAALFNQELDQYLSRLLPDAGDLTRFEQLLVASIRQALAGSGVAASDPETILIISSTKGNIPLLEAPEPIPDLKNRISLFSSAQRVASYLHFAHRPLVVSNACISGLLGIITGSRLIQSGRYKNAVVAGADLISKFVLSGFQSFQAVSPEPCRPFDKDRTGITLGEASATMILTCKKDHLSHPIIKVLGGRTGNDANHISGPSRSGNELSYIIQKVLRDASVSAQDIDFISAHGTATLYNDEMEAKAISLAGMDAVPVNSLKGYYGHTLGAAGLVESIITIASMKEDLVLPTMGFREHGVTKPIHVNRSLLHTPLEYCLKTASGFGGCNAAVLYSKTQQRP